MQITLTIPCETDRSMDAEEALYRAWMAFSAKRLTCNATSQDRVTIYDFLDIKGNKCELVMRPVE